MANSIALDDKKARKGIRTKDDIEAQIKKMKKVKDNDGQRTKLNVLTWILLAGLVLYTVSLFTPLVWAFLKSIQEIYDYTPNKLFLPKEFAWNYGIVFEHFTVEITNAQGISESVGMPMMYLNTILYAVGCAFTLTLVPCITAYMSARFPYAFGKVLVTVVLIVMVVPIIGALPSELQFAKFFGFYDQIWGLWIMRGNFLGLYFLIFHSMWRGVPKEFTEAAKVDGASNLRILIRIMLPLARNTFFTVMLLHFIGFWNDYGTPLMWMPSHPTAAYGLYVLAFTTGNDMSRIPRKMAAAMTLLIPMLIVFSIFQKRLVGNLSMGGVKG